MADVTGQVRGDVTGSVSGASYTGNVGNGITVKDRIEAIENRLDNATKVLYMTTTISAEASKVTTKSVDFGYEFGEKPIVTATISGGATSYLNTGKFVIGVRSTTVRSCALSIYNASTMRDVDINLIIVGKPKT